jgi:hypothetical protein
MKKDKIIIITSIIVCIIGAFFTIKNMIGNNSNSPVSASGMTIEERGDFDSKAIKNGIKSNLNDSLYTSIEKIKIDYKYDSMTVYTKLNKTDQYSEDNGNKIEKAVDDFLSNRNKVTLENSSYIIHVKGKDSLFDLND